MNERETSQRQTIRETTGDADATQSTEVREQRAPSPDAVQKTVQDTGRDTTTESGFLPDDRMDSMRERWDDVQNGFVDDPRNAVQNAHQLVTELVNELTETFTRERGTLESQWSGGGQADTETLRVALQRYRIFFNRLLGT